RGVLELAAIAPGERVLDVGCGPGRLTLAAALAAEATGETVGIDASPEMIQVATRKAMRAGSSAQFRVAAIEAIPSEDNHFDVVLANLMLHHLPLELQRRGVAEVFRVLKPNGRFIVAEFSAAPRHGVGHLLCVLGVRRGSDHAEHLRSLAGAAGFESIQVAPATSSAFCLLSARKPALRS
ncbi:MAG TPA: class I SAM-dependent methyltransferase, partial [Myxococcaceae bacterium]|nr:class I SAM-dependent methyltransferase [Myxococcaceae bacterium]